MLKNRLVIALLIVGIMLAMLPASVLACGDGSCEPPPPPPPFQGCTPGYWKNHLDAWWYYSEPNDFPFDFPASLSELADDSLIDSLNYKGGSGLVAKARILLRAAVAAKANIVAGLNYPTGYNELINAVNVALASENEDQILALASQLDAWNNLGCPLN